ncbi:hypothetical protein [Streptomyces mirabilis]|uniref:DNA-directed RNA polymerase n=1 Tax=Streptomyces mirabilis TaxID=68239 RepID=A0A1I2W8Z5_9ACTN|nr:hypothetical protein [Streptomyces mirabilis]SFG97928.1 RNA polymerase Rpb2, domain 6 [Streptomyces mirabilis]
MESIGDEVAALYGSGVPGMKLRQLCRDWKQNPTDYGLSRTVLQAIEDDSAEEVYETLIDDEFRASKSQLFGIEELRRDIRAGLAYFSAHRPDLARYIHMILLEQAAAGDAEFMSAQRRSREGFANFLQLDALPDERRDMGLHRALARFFPVDSGKLSGEQPATTVRLAGYELGVWACSCGSSAGFAKRYDFACACGAVHGNGRLTADVSACAHCGRPPGYSKCSTCATRVTLENLWTLRRGGAPLSAYQVPLVLDLLVECAGLPSRRVRMPLMLLPVPLGIREHQGSVVFDFPAVFWLGEFDKWGGLDLNSGTRFISLDDLQHYDRQTDMCKILEAAFRRTLWESKLRKGSYRQFGNRLLEWLRNGQSDTPDHDYTRGLRERIGYDMHALKRRDLNLLQFTGDGAECRVAASDRVVGNGVLISSGLARSSFLSVPYLLNLRATFPDDAILTSQPPDVAAHRTSSLEPCGLPRPGQLVEPGQALIGIAERLADTAEMRAEERLLHNAFGHPVFRDASLYMPGMRPGRVLVQQFVLRRPDIMDIPAAPGRLIMRTSGRSHDHINVTVAVDRPVETGDVLLDSSGASAVVSGIAARQVLGRIAGAEAEPDLVVAPDHPWAPEAGSSVLRRVPVKRQNLEPASSSITAYATPYYSRPSRQPLNDPGVADSAQILEPEHFRWLIDIGARGLAMELYAPRGDCVVWRVALQVQEVLQGPVRTLPHGTSVSSWAALSESPSEAVRLFDQFLRGARVAPHIREGRVGFALMTDADVLAVSHGEVTTHLKRVAERRGSGGLYSEQIFGTPRDWMCACGRKHGDTRGKICGQCGVQPADHRERRHWMGHIELPVPVVHGWFLHGAAAEKLADFLGLHVEQLRQIADCWNIVVVDPGTSRLCRGQYLQRDDEWLKYSSGADGVRLAAGGEAIEFLIKQASRDRRASVPVDGIVIRRLPVLSPELHADEQRPSDYFSGSGLGIRYRNVLRCIARIRRASGRFRSFTQLADYAALQEGVEHLVDHGRTTPGFHYGIRLTDPRAGSIADRLLPAREPSVTLRDRLLKRTVDYSASARLVTSYTPDLGTALLPPEMARTLLELDIFGELVRSGAARTFPDARDLVERRTDQAEAALRTACARALILLAPPQGPWPIVALRVQLVDGHAVHIHPALLDQIGWGNIGQTAKILSILTAKAMTEAQSLLTPSRLKAMQTSDIATRPTAESIFDLQQRELIDQITLAAWNGESFPLEADDHLVLCDSDWLSP